MQIKVEIDVKPEELRRFLGLPDVAGLQDDLVGYLRDKVGQASDGLSPATDFVRGNLESMLHNSALHKLFNSVKVRLSDDPAATAPVEPAPTTPAAKRRAAKKATAKSKPAAG